MKTAAQEDNEDPYFTKTHCRQRYHDLVLAERSRAWRLGRHLMKHWNARLDDEEFEAVVDLALCEAASRYNSKSGVKFSTYLFYFVKGALIRAICFARNEGFIASDSEDTLQRSERAVSRSTCDGSDSSSNPERAFYLGELRTICHQAMQSLNELERAVVYQVHVQERKVAHVARELGYSRGHLSEIRSRAFRKLKGTLSAVGEEVLLEAA